MWLFQKLKSEDIRNCGQILSDTSKRHSFFLDGCRFIFCFTYFCRVRLCIPPNRFLNMPFPFRIVFISIVFCLLAIFPENLSRSALPFRDGFLTPNEETKLYRHLMRDKINKVDALMNRFSWFKGNIMVVKDHKIIYQRSNGFANYQTRTPLTVKSVFELASVSKQFTAIAILMLYERKLIDIDDLLSLYIPELPYKGVTIRHLLNHTSGLPNYMWVLENNWKYAHLPSNEEMIQMLAAHPPNVSFQPGRRHSYSNTGYALLASVVERVTGKPFSQFMRENVFEPLGMENTFTSTEVMDSVFYIPHLVSGHRATRRGFIRINPSVNNRVLGDKGIHSNLEDLYRWDQSFYNEKLVKQSTLRQAYKSLTLTNRRSFPYGFGFRIGDKNGERYVFHHGLWEGFRTSFMRYIEHGNAIVILNNTNQNLNAEIVNQVESILDEPAEISPTAQLALCIIYDGLPAAVEMFSKMKDSGTIVTPDAQEFFQIAALLREMNKPELSNRLFNLYEMTLQGNWKDAPVAIN